jgi:hypothetical protein
VVNVEKEQVEPKENYTMFIFNWNMRYGIEISRTGRSRRFGLSREFNYFQLLYKRILRLIMKGLHTIVEHTK